MAEARLLKNSSRLGRALVHMADQYHRLMLVRIDLGQAKFEPADRRFSAGYDGREDPRTPPKCAAADRPKEAGPSMPASRSQHKALSTSRYGGESLFRFRLSANRFNLASAQVSDQRRSLNVFSISRESCITDFSNSISPTAYLTTSSLLTMPHSAPSSTTGTCRI